VAQPPMPSSSRAAPVGAAPIFWVVAYTAFLAAAGLAIGIFATGSIAADRFEGAWLSVLGLTVALTAAGFLQLEFWYGKEGESFDLSEAVLAPVIFVLPPLGAVAVIALAQTVAETLLRRHPVKATFNVAQWMFATAIGSVIFAQLRPGTATPRDLPALIAALVTISLVNHVALIGVFWLDQRGPLRQVLATTGSGVVFGWVMAGVNVAFGVLFVASYMWVPVATLLFIVPLAMLHWATRAYGSVRADRARLAGMQQATHALAVPMNPRDAVPEFLAEVRRCFESEVAELVIVL
jgi:hypothetical protein